MLRGRCVSVAEEFREDGSQRKTFLKDEARTEPQKARDEKNKGEPSPCSHEPWC